MENNKTTEKAINKTTETLRKELETMNSSELHDMFMVFYTINYRHGYMIYGDKFNEFLESFTSNPFRINEDKTFKKELIDNLIKYNTEHMSLLTASLLIKKKFTIEEVVDNYYANVDAFGNDMFF